MIDGIKYAVFALRTLVVCADGEWWALWGGQALGALDDVGVPGQLFIGLYDVFELISESILLQILDHDLTNVLHTLKE